MAGRRHTDEAREKIRAARARQRNITGGGPAVRPAVERFLDKVSIPGDCWEWNGALNKGYGVFGVGSARDGTRRTVLAYRFAYEHFVGPVPAGLELDHLCRNKRCVNPAHLEPVTHAENLQRARVADGGGQ